MDQPAPEPEIGNGGSTSSALQSELLANITGLQWFTFHAIWEQAGTLLLNDPACALQTHRWSRRKRQRLLVAMAA